jgi:hypothetical protein
VGAMLVRIRSPFPCVPTATDTVFENLEHFVSISGFDCRVNSSIQSAFDEVKWLA